MLAGLFVLVLAMTVSVLVGERRAIDSVRGLFQGPDSPLIYAHLRSWIVLAEWTVGVLTMVLAVAWGWFSFGAYLVSNAASDLIIERIIPQDRKHSRRSRSYLKVLRSTVGRRLQMASYGLIFLTLIALVWAQVWNFTLDQVVDALVLSTVLVTPVFFTIEWYQLSRIRATRSLKMQASFDDYVFSEQALFVQLKATVKFGFTLAILGWVLLPGFVVTLHAVEDEGARLLAESADYSAGWSILVADGYPTHTAILGPNLDLPAPDDLDSYLSWVGLLHEDFDARVIIKRFQEGMFVVFVIVTALAVGIPTALGAVMVPERRQAIRSALFSVTMSAGLFAGLGIFYRLAFFQDTTNSFGLAAIVTLFVRYVLALRQRK